MTTEDDVRDALSRTDAGAAFVEELHVMLGARYEPHSFVDALERLSASGGVTVTAKPVPDPHLAGMDLRIVASVNGNGSEAQARALEATERCWTEWLREFFASHRCS